MQNDHSFAYIFSADVAEGQGSRLASRAARDLYPFSLDGAHLRSRELAERVGSNENGVTSVYNTRLNYTGNDGSDEGNREGIIYVEL